MADEDEDLVVIEDEQASVRLRNKTRGALTAELSVGGGISISARGTPGDTVALTPTQVQSYQIQKLLARGLLETLRR